MDMFVQALRRAVAIWPLVLIAAAILVLISFLSDPFGQRSAARAHELARIRAIERNAVAKAGEAKGEAFLRRRLEDTLTTEQQHHSALSRLTTRAAAAPDAAAPVPPDRVRRIRENDADLCRLSQLNGCEGVGL